MTFPPTQSISMQIEFCQMIQVHTEIDVAIEKAGRP